MDGNKMEKYEFVNELLEKLDEITLAMDDWDFDDTFYLAQEYAQELQDELESIRNE